MLNVGNMKYGLFKFGYKIFDPFECLVIGMDYDERHASSQWDSF